MCKLKGKRVGNNYKVNTDTLIICHKTIARDKLKTSHSPLSFNQKHLPQKLFLRLQ